MKHLIFKSSFQEKLKVLIIPMMLLTLGVGQTWGWGFSGDNFIYFHNKGGWNDSGKMLFIGKSNYSSVYTMSAVTGNSSLWVVKITNAGWSDATYMAVAGGSNVWGSGSWGPSNRTNATHYTNTYTSGVDASNNQRYMLTPASGSNNANLSLAYLGTGEPNYTITVKAKVSTNGGSSYSEATSPGTLSASSKKFTAYNSCNSTTSLSSGTITCGYYATTTLTAADATGYDFVGWYNSSGTRQTTSKTLTIYPTADATYYAYYKVKQYTVSYGVNSSTRNGSIKLNSGSAVTTTSSSTLNHGTAIAFTATPNSGYQVEGWYSDAACSAGNRLQSGGTSYNAGTLTAAKTVYVKFAVRTGGTVTLNAGSNGQVSLDNSSWGATKTKTDITTNTAFNIYAKGNTGYQFSSWTKSSGSGTIGSTSTANTTFTPVAYEDASLTAAFAETKSTITVTTATTSWGSLKFESTAKNWGTTASLGVATTQNITATAASGYKFVRWNLTGAAASSSTLTGATITLKADGSGSTGTATAVFEEDLTTTWYIAGATDTNYPFTGWGTSGIRMEKKTGHSTEEIYYCNVVVNRVATGNEYEFQTYNSANDTYYGYNNKDITKENNSTTVYSGNPNNMHFKPYLTGTYEFKLDNTGANPVLTVTWPVYNQVRISAASPTADATNVGNFDLGAAVSNVRSVTRSLKANDTYTFKVVSNSEWYGYNSGAFTRSTSTSSNSLTTSTSGGDMTLTTDYAGDYTFKFNESTKALSVDFPAAYKVTYGKGSVNGSSGSCSAIDLDNGSATVTSNSTWVLSGHRVKLTAPDEKSGYSWKGWYGNNAGTGDAISANKVCTLTVSSAKTAYACYTENNYTVTVAASAGGSVASASVTAHKDTKVSLPNATANNGYYFTGWEVTSGTASITGGATDGKINGVSATGVAVRANFAPIWYLKGDFNSWGETHPLTLASSTSGSVTLTTTSAKLSNQKFKIWNKQTDKYYQKANRSITRAANTANSDWTEGGTSNDMKFTSDVIGNYTFAVTFTSNIPSALTVTYPTAYTVTFGKGTGGNTISATATNPSGAISSGDYVASGATVTFSQTALAGYTFKGWYTTVDGNTSAGVNGSNQLTINGTKTVYAQYTPNTYTVSFDNNGGSGATPGNKTVTYGQAYGTLPVGPTPPGADQFVGWFTDKTGGTQVTSSTIVSTASDHKLWARFESTFTVTVQYKCGADVLRAPTTTHASETSVAAEITAPEILGYSFVNWTGDNATFADATSATTTVNVTSATTVVANYNAVPMVYFKNNLDWDDVYVTFDCAFNGEVPSLSGKPYYKMTRLGQSSDIFYCVIPSTYTENNYEHWAWYIAFDNTGTGYNESKHTGTYAFNSGEFIGRKDFDPRATMFIPYDGDTKSLNGGTTYQTGCWLQYNTNYSAYRVRVNTYVQGSGGSEVQDIELRSDVAGATEFKAKVYLGNANHVYGVMLYKDHMKNTNDIWYTNVNNEANTITSATTSLPWSWQKCEEDWQRCRVKTESLGNYIFTVSFATGRPMVDIEYPVTIGDFRLVYKDLATWNITHDEDWQQISPVFKKKANRVDTASFFVSYGSSPTVELQKCTAINPSTGAETWTKQGDNINISSITKKGVYNFTVIQNNDASGATAAYLGAYSGKYYVRTDVSDGGWNDYKSTANAMTYTEYSMEHGGSSGPYSYYFMRHVDAGSNIKFLVANDYSLCLTDTMIDDTYAHEWIEREANVRFTWNHTNNEIHRAYISGSSYIYDRFLVLEGDDKLFDADGHPLTGTYQVAGLNEYEMNFTDDQNWVYETTVQAKPNERVKLTAKFNDKIQYFYGAEGERTKATTYQLIGGTGSTMYKMRVVYDFKTNRLLAAWLPNGDISDPTPINADVMIIRYHQDDAQQITFSGDGKLTDVKTVYGAMEFNKYRLNNQGEEYPHGNLGISQYERDLFFISFPFDVKLNDVFGFGTYGKHWIIEYYDGKTRAKNGYWKDSPTNWKFVTKAMKDSYTLKANEGYVLALDLDELKPESSVWNYGVENVYLYFPSTAAVEDIQATHKTVEIDTVGYQCTINRNTAQGDRRVKDSHWHLIGVPSYANADHSTSDSWAESKGDLEQTIYYPNIDPAAWTSAAPFVYDWDASSNKFGVLRATSYSFKPMHSYLVQYARDTLEWRQVNTTPAAIAARRAMFAKEPCDFRLELLQDENVIDQAFISMRDDEEVTAEFDFNYDLSKMLYGAFTSKSNIYTFAGNEEVAANCLPFKEETTVVPVGLTVDEEGEYIFSIPDGTSGVGVTLVDNERQIRTNLALTDYMTYLPAGDHNNRFVLEISPIEQIVTGVEMINGENGDASLNGENVTGVCKKLIDGLLYIVKDGKVFDARGARLQ